MLSCISDVIIQYTMNCLGVEIKNMKQLFLTYRKMSRVDRFLTTLYFSLYIFVALALLIKQPFGNPPDEYNRFLIPEFIAKHGYLPNGYDPQIRIEGYGFSYAFQPILPYILQGYAMRFATLLGISSSGLLYVARSINFLFGFGMAIVVRKLSKLWFSKQSLQYCFAYLVTFLPQSIFLHTYVNTDSCCMLSIALILYGLTAGFKNRFSYKNCIILSIGIILCAQSYYNAYGFILCSIILYLSYFLLQFRGNKPDTKQLFFDFVSKSSLICGVVLIGIVWWFLRSGLLYNGDFLGMEARNQCALLFATPDLKPGTQVTWFSLGYSIMDMLLQSDFVHLSSLSFIGMYGAMEIMTSVWIYRFYRGLIALTLIAALICPAKALTNDRKHIFHPSKGFNFFVQCNFLLCILIPVALSTYYSYKTDYQPQGRYMLPALIPLCYYCLRGVEKIVSLLTNIYITKKPAKIHSFESILTGLFVIFLFLVILSLLVTVFGYAYPFYEANPIAP